MSVFYEFLPDFVKIPDFSRSGRDASVNQLKSGDLEIISINECKKAYKGDTLTNDMFCAGSDFGVDTCLGDSGGPLVCEDPYTGLWEISGVTSWGRGCGVAKFPGVYTKVVNYLGWLEMIATGKGRPSRTKHMQDYEYETSGDYEYDDTMYETPLEEELQSFKDQQLSEKDAMDALFSDSVTADGLLPETVDFPIGPDSGFDSDFCRETLTELQGEILTPGYRNRIRHASLLYSHS